MKNKPLISVVICTYNRERYLPQLFDSILNQTLSRSEFELILINNNSPGNTEELFNGFKRSNPDIDSSYFLETNQGLSFARNRGIKESNGEYITFLDDDAFIETNYLHRITSAFQANAVIEAIGGKILLHYETIVPKWENKYLNSLLGFYDKGDVTFVYNQAHNDYPRGSNMAFKLDLLKKIGAFDVTLGRVGGNLMGGEEKELFDRIYGYNKNCTLYIPDAVVYHCVPIERTTKDFIIKQALGTGKSERLRTKKQGSISYLKRILIEITKWGASFILFFTYLLKRQKEKGKMIIVFRWWVTKGLLFK